MYTKVERNRLLAEMAKLANEVGLGNDEDVKYHMGNGVNKDILAEFGLRCLSQYLPMLLSDIDEKDSKIAVTRAVLPDLIESYRGTEAGKCLAGCG